MLTLAPAVLLIRRTDESSERILLEWSSLVTAALAISTIPASYNFVLMVFPICVLGSILLERRSHGWLFALLFAYLGIGFPLAVPEHARGLKLLLYVPRLPLMLGVLFGHYALQWRGLPLAAKGRDRTGYAWAAAMLVFVLVSIHSTLRVERGERKEYLYRLPPAAQGFANTHSQRSGTEMRFIRFSFAGYQLVTKSDWVVREHPSNWAPDDIVTFTASAGKVYAERVSASASGSPAPHFSEIVDVLDHSRVIVEHAHDPELSRDDRLLAFLRDDHGRAQLMLRRHLESAASDVPLTPTGWNVYEASFLSGGDYAVAATKFGGSPQIYLTDSTHQLAPVALPDSRYPALSLDGRWMAYSHLDHGFWNLWLRDESSGTSRRIANEPCNQMQPSWESDSKTLLYGSDCGRSIWFTAISQRKVIP
jgi:hypothetical protein